MQSMRNVQRQIFSNLDENNVEKRIASHVEKNVESNVKSSAEKKKKKNVGNREIPVESVKPVEQVELVEPVESDAEKQESNDDNDSSKEELQESSDDSYSCEEERPVSSDDNDSCEEEHQELPVKPFVPKKAPKKAPVKPDALKQGEYSMSSDEEPPTKKEKKEEEKDYPEATTSSASPSTSTHPTNLRSTNADNHRDLLKLFQTDKFDHPLAGEVALKSGGIPFRLVPVKTNKNNRKNCKITFEYKAERDFKTDYKKASNGKLGE
jgi:hypothetical protein